MQSSELNQWLEQQRELWQRALAHAPESLESDWQPLFDAVDAVGRSTADLTQRELARQLAEQLRDFCTLGLEWLRISQNAERQTATQLLLTLADQLHQQTSTALLRQWQLPQALNQWLNFQQPQGSPLQAINPLIQQLQNTFHDSPITELMGALIKFQHALLAYQSRLQHLSHEVATKLIQQQLERPAGRLIALYDAWVDLYEESYRAMLLDPEYSRCYGELINSSLRVQRATQNYWEPLLRQVGATPRTEHQALLEAHQLTRKQLRALTRERKQQAARLDRLEEQLDLLSEQQSSNRPRRSLRKV